MEARLLGLCFCPKRFFNNLRYLSLICVFCYECRIVAKVLLFLVDAWVFDGWFLHECDLLLVGVSGKLYLGVVKVSILCGL